MSGGVARQDAWAPARTRDATIDTGHVPNIGGAFRPDVEGLRALAVLLVMLFHAGVPAVSGGYVGVDVFFVISGFLITGLLLREIQRHGRVDYRKFYARRAKRLLPASALVLGAVAVSSYLLLPVTQWGAVSSEIMAATFYVVNWVFANKATDYFAQDAAESPVQHFWSLSVEEQFYFFWPTLLAVFAAAKLLSRWRVRQRLLLAMLVVLLPSLTYSLYLTSADESRAYFVTTTRLWEMALGGLVALTAARWTSLPARARALLGWLGVAAILAAALWFTPDTPFPGFAALLPTVGAALVIGTGVAASRGGPMAVLGSAPMVWIGGMSYSLYLWHWPMAVIAESRWGDAGGWVAGLAVAASLLPAWLSLRFVENPVRFSPRLAASHGRALAMGAGLMVVSLVAALLLGQAYDRARVNTIAEMEASDSRLPGAALMYDADFRSANPEAPSTSELVVPDPILAPEDRGSVLGPYCKAPNPAVEANPCWLRVDEAGQSVSVRVESPQEIGGDGVTIVLIGDSHAAQWGTSFAPLSELEGVDVVTMTKSGCAVTREQREDYPECVEWSSNVLELLSSADVDLVVGTSLRRARDVEVEGLVDAYEEIAASGVPVVHLVDSPNMRSVGNVADCVVENRADLRACAVTIEQALPPAAGEYLQSNPVPGVDVLDLTTGFCLDLECPAVVGGVLMYVDESHISGTYAATMAPYLERGLQRLGHLG